MDSFPISEHDPLTLFPALQEIPQRPKKLFARGKLIDVTDKKLVVVVGSRNCTSYGRHVCRELIAGLTNYPVVIVSGLALGIDSVAHESALEYGLPTFAFPGSGLARKFLYPARHLSLAEQILQHGGALFSEYPPETKAALWTFPQRNRLMAGIADIVITIEAEEKSGSLITSRLGTEYNKIVGAVPGNITSPNSKGTNWLLTLGAVPITSVDDIIRELGLDTQEKLFTNVVLTVEEENLLHLLSGPQTRDTLCRTLACDIATLNRLLSILEIKGCIRESFGLIERIA